MWYNFRGDIFAHGFSEKMAAFVGLNAAATDAIRGLTTWRSELTIRGAKIPLFTVEDDEGAWPDPSCKHCRVANCDTALFPIKRFHMIIPIEEQWNDPLNETILDHPEGNSLLYAVIHSNAFSHVLWVQRSSTGLMSGSDFMDLWECIVKYLEISDVTLEDISTKEGVDLPILYGLAHEKSWFARWGYQFWKGSYGADQLKYQAALAYLRNLNINKAAGLFEEEDRTALETIHKLYQGLSPGRIDSLGEMLQFILTYPAKLKMVSESVSMTNIPRKRWTRSQVNAVLTVLLRVLVSSGQNPVRKEDLEDEASSQNLPRQLSDHVISSLKNVKYGDNRIVVCREDKFSKLVEYWLELIPLPTTESLDVYQDAVILYDIIIRRYPENSSDHAMMMSAKKALVNYKFLIKGAAPQTREEVKIVKCKCGAREDDGETFAQCSICELYEHLECNELESDKVLLCGRCLIQEDEKWMVAEAEEKSKQELKVVEEDEVYQE